MPDGLRGHAATAQRSHVPGDMIQGNAEWGRRSEA
jgi:hypothetical protein